MKNMKNTSLADAISLAAAAFVDKTDKSGKPYILHCLHVMATVDQTDPELMTIAVLHDIVEDTNYTLMDLFHLGYSDRVINALELLTHEEDVSYEDYIAAISSNEDATKVKIADLMHNSDITRLKGVRDKDLERIQKYHKAFVVLTAAQATQRKHRITHGLHAT